MSTLWIIMLILLVVAAIFSAMGYGRAGISPAAIILLVVLILWLTGILSGDI